MIQMNVNKNYQKFKMKAIKIFNRKSKQNTKD